MRTLSFDEKHLPDVDWCLKALSALDPLHLIFDPEYETPKRKKRLKIYSICRGAFIFGSINETIPA